MVAVATRAETKMAKRAPPLEEPFGEGDAAESGSGGGEQQNPYKRDPPGAIEIALGADLCLQGSNIREQIARSSVHAEAPRVSTMRSNLPPRGTRRTRRKSRPWHRAGA